MLVNILIPKSERKNALLDLHYMNINEFTLFGDDSSLVQYAAWEAFFHKKYIGNEINPYLKF